MTIKTVHRYDAPGKITVVQTEEGFLLTTGKLAKPGIMLYRRGDGEVIRELVEPEVLKDETSNASLFGKALTIEHPEDDVTPDNWKDLAHGSWGYPKYHEDHEDGPGLYAPVTIHTREALKILEDPDGLRELSPGYTVKVDETPGEHPEFGPYDTKQIPGSRRYNHGALTAEARGGPDLTIRKDSAYQCEDKDMEEEEKDQAPKSDEGHDKEKMDMGEKLDAFMSKMEDAMKSLSDRLDQLEGDKDDASDEDPDQEEDSDDQDDMSKADRLDWFKERRELEDLAGQFRVKADGLDDADLKLAIVQAARPGLKRKDSAYIDAVLDTIREGHISPVSERYAGIGSALVPEDDNGRKDAKDRNPIRDFFAGAAGKLKD